MNIYSLLIGVALGVGGTIVAYEMIEAQCEDAVTKSIKWSEAKTFTSAYLTAASPHLKTSDGATLKGWFMEKCWIDALFARYPQADPKYVPFIVQPRINCHNIAFKCGM
jgi:hypothetical protein